MKFIIAFLSTMWAIPLLAQDQQELKGTVLELNKQPLMGVTVYWLDDPSTGVFTNENGFFKIPFSSNGASLVFSMVGMKSDTLSVSSASQKLLVTLMEDSQTLNQVVVKGSSNFIDKASPQQIEVITAKTLTKAACCNLSEAFETNASVSIAVNDAVTGARQLQLHGLSGKYVQTNFENLPNVRGLASTFGLSYTPGTWIQSIDIIKGAGSVVNGYESMSGGVNVEYQKPHLADKLLVNTYVNSLGRLEGNVNFTHKFNEKLSTAILSHGSVLNSEIDRNDDTFFDTPQFNQVNLLNRWNYRSERIHAQWGARILEEERIGGQSESLGADAYRFQNKTKRYELFSKTGFLFPDKPYRGIALLAQAVSHKSESTFGEIAYNGNETSVYANLIYQDIIGTTTHTYKTGFSFLHDNFDEVYHNINSDRVENVPGVYFEYTYKPSEQTALVLGLRNDFHNLFGNQVSPRLHFKQELTSKATWRVNAGKGFRTPNYWAESFSHLVSNRVVTIENELSPEELWNFGTSLTIDFLPKMTLILDAYHSSFIRQQMYDLMNPGRLRIYSSTEQANVTSLQAEVKWQPIDRFDVNLAYKRIENLQTFLGVDGSKVFSNAPFVPPHTWHFNTSYATNYEKWKFDLTVHYNGNRQIPFNLDEIGKTSGATFKPVDGFFIVNTQVNRNFRKWEYYLGAENLLNFKQELPIVGFNNPQGDNFDGGLVYGPIVGRIIYFGTRFKIQ